MSCSSFSVTAGLLVATLIFFSLHPHLITIVLTVFHGGFSALAIDLYISPDWYLSTIKSSKFFGSSLWPIAGSQ